MHPSTLNANARDGGTNQSFNARGFRRIVLLPLSQRGTLIAGLLATVAFAVFHTVSIAGAFPIFKVLLEEEGVRSWAHRYVAGQRIGLELVPVDDSTLEVQKVRSGGRAAAAGIQLGDAVVVPAGAQTPTDDRSAWLADLAASPAGDEVELILRRRGDPQQVVSLTPARLGTSERLLLSVTAMLPADVHTPEGKLRTLICLLVVLCIIVFIAGVFRFLGEVLISHAVFRSLLDLRAKLYERTLFLPMSFFAGQTTADVVTRFVQDMQEIQRGLMTFFGKCLREPLRAVFILCWAFILDWRIMLAMVIIAPLTVIIFWAVGRQVKNANRRLLRGYGRMIDALTASLQSLRVVKAYTAEAYEQRRLAKVDHGMFRDQMRLVRLQALVSPAVEVLAVVAGSVATVWLANRVLQRDLPVSTFLALGATLAMLFDPLRRLSDVYVRVKRSTAGAERVFQVLDQPLERDGQTHSAAVGPLTRGIVFDRVEFTYPGAQRPALEDISLAVARGETIAIVGPNGCGKTTLVSMIPRLLAYDGGRILYDDVELSTVNLKSLREHISLVSQETIIFAGTPIENIAYGRRVDDHDAVVDAARRAFADEFISALPNGYRTVLGERGTTLSGGQRQRLAIARAIYRDAPILIFDEATSQVDSESEGKIQRAVREFCVGRTTIIIAHRLSTIQFADRIVVMNEGRIIDSGSHDELLPRCELYRILCSTQLATAGDAAIPQVQTT